MPLGNLTSQFFANIYLNELDQFVKHTLRVKYYIRYVDDFVILDENKENLELYKVKINTFLNQNLKIELHPDKSTILKLDNGVNFLGFRIFYYHKLLRLKNIKKFRRKLLLLKEYYQNDLIEREKIIEVFEGWLAYSSNADSYKYKKYITRQFNKFFPTERIKINNIAKNERFFKKIQETDYTFANQKTLQLFKKKLTISEIAEKRGIKESTVWEHLAKLVEHDQLNIWKIMSGKKVKIILQNIKSSEDRLKDIKLRINDQNINFNEINCVLASLKRKIKKRNIIYHVRRYKKTHCFRKCYFESKQRALCSNKFDNFMSKNPNLEMTKKEFLELFNNHIDICILPKKEKSSFIPYKDFVNKIRSYRK